VLIWQTVIHVAFLFSALAIALADRLMSHASAQRPLSRPAAGRSCTGLCQISAGGDAVNTLGIPLRGPHDHHIRQADLVESVAAALQYISYYHPADFIAHLARAYEREQSAGGQGRHRADPDQLAHVRRRHRPICQDTGIVNVFLKIGMDVRWEGFERQRGRGERRRAPGLPEPRQRAARQRAGRPHLRAQEHQGQHAAVIHMTWCPATSWT
jgi:hypothetical protein